MDLSSFIQYIPTTLYGLIGLLIIITGYCLLEMMKNHRAQNVKLIEMIEAKDKNYTSFVEENNHQKTDIFDTMLNSYQEGIKTNAEFRVSIENNNRLLDIVINRMK